MFNYEIFIRDHLKELDNDLIPDFKNDSVKIYSKDEIDNKFFNNLNDLMSKYYYKFYKISALYTGIALFIMIEYKRDDIK